MSDDLIGRADSLMRRSRTFVAGRVAPAVVDDGIPLLTEEVDLDTLVPEPEDRSAEITAAVTAEVTERVTAEVTERVTAEVTERVTAEVTERVTAEVTERVTDQVARAVGTDVRARLQQATSDALSQHFSDLPALVQNRIDDWCTTTLPALVSIEMQVAFEAALGAALEGATARIREQAVLDLRESIAADIENRSQAVLNATVEPSDQPDQPL
ncbi:hypothetical protein [Methyloversatilis discipulorum]|uniref:hypothetical protein n=1 Tax=Methyloversatilis discipulorum TaxID=1119528 RepID=UPI001A5979D1|nr:hypothetical protein [Methyloversatilis discipulorum]MBL8468064.1 hypothetical protein [Methyloversatilis discipulorum]